jgi:formate dehydrogenase major subunit
MGAAPGYTVGYRAIGDADTRAQLHSLWGAPLPQEPGLPIPEMLAAARRGSLRMLWSRAKTSPRAIRTRRA